MADRLNYYFRQKVTEAELDLGFELVEKAQQNFAADIRVYGVVSGAVPTAHSPVPNMSIDLTAPARAYDHLGRRIFFGTGQVVDLSVDLVGIPTDVAVAGNERWLSVFVRFRRSFSDPRTDGNSQQVFFRADESFELVVRQAPEGAIGSAPRPPFEPEELLVCDVRRRGGQTQILIEDIDVTRRQAFVFAQGSSVSIAPQGWTVLSPASLTVQAALDEADAELADHFSGTARRHPGTAIDFTPRGFIAANNVQAAIHELVDDLSANTANAAGASRIGADGVAGTPNALSLGTVDSQIAQLLGFVNTHVGAAAGAHNASAIAATAHGTVTATNVQSQLQEIVADLTQTTTAAPGSGLVGIDAIAGTPNAITAGTVRAAIAQLLSGLNTHIASSAGHAAQSIPILDAGANLNAPNVEAALAEIVDAYEGDHFRGNENTPGQHRTIRQPAFGSGRVLIFDSGASGFGLTHFRMYVDASGVGTDSLWLTLNAAWNGSASNWVRDTAGSSSSALRLSAYEFGLHCKSGIDGGATFTDWTTTWKLPFTADINSAFETTGRLKETGRCGVQYFNTNAGNVNVYVGGSATFRTRMAASPSSITFTQYMSSTGTATIAVLNAATDRDGFAYQVNGSAGGNNSFYWFGSYTATA